MLEVVDVVDDVDVVNMERGTLVAVAHLDRHNNC